MTLYYTREGEPVIYRVTTAGVSFIQGVYTNPAVPCGALSWDAGIGQLWCGSYDGTGSVYTLDPNTGAATLRFTQATFGGIADDGCYGSGAAYIDGLALDDTDGTLWLSGDAARTIYHVTATGTLLGSFTAPNHPITGVTGCNTGIEVIPGGFLALALQDDTGQGPSMVAEIRKADNVNNPPLVASFIAYPDGTAGIEDVAYDPNTFAPHCALWSNEWTAGLAQLTAWDFPCPTNPPTTTTHTTTTTTTSTVTTTTIDFGPCTAARVGYSCGSSAAGCGCTVLCSENCAPQCVIFASPSPCQTDADCASISGARCVADHPQACSATSGSCTFGVCLQPCTAPTTTPTTTSTSSTTSTTLVSGCFTDTGDGTIHDTCTGLQWEKKTTTAGLQNVTNLYSWAGCCNGCFLFPFEFCQPNTAAAATCAAQADGGTQGCSVCASGTCNVDEGALTTVWDWVNQVNAANFAGHSDWRLPSEGGNNSPSTGARELETIRLAPYPCGTSPCIAAIFGPTASSYYWSASTSTYTSNPALARGVDFNNGILLIGPKDSALYVRAVR